MPRIAVIPPALIALVGVSPFASAAPVDFARDVRPIFERSCYSCHGPEKGKGELRLHTRAAAFEGGLSGAVIVPGKPKDSLLLTRILGEGDEERMPVKAPPLSPAETEIIRRWIAEGAVWPESGGVVATKPALHWAYVKPVRPEPPAVKRAAWARSALDRFVLSRLEKEGLTPAPEADRETLLRRVSLDLTGLPPTIAEIDAFLGDRRRDAYERVVERLLASPHYGERWARLWLDLARYADSNGYEKDRPRVAWKYRDWVIQALNRNVSFQQFTVEQIAGDMLPNPTEAQRIATGFHRNTLLNQEGGIDIEEARWETLVDRVGTTATVWLGSTLACAQCHNHKYDPFSQKDFFRLLAFFDNVPYTVGGQGVDRWIEEPTLWLPSAEQKAARERLEGELASLRERLKVKTPEARAALRAWEGSVRVAETAWTPLQVERAISKGGANLRTLKDGSLLASGPNPDSDVYEIDTTTKLANVTGFRLEVLNDPSLPTGGPGRNKDGNFFLSELSVRVAPIGDEGDGQPLRFSAAVADESVSNTTVDTLLTPSADDGWAIDPGQAPKPARRQAILVLDKPLPNPNGVRLFVRLAHRMPRTSRNIGRLRLSVTSAGDPTLAAIVPTHLRPLLELAPERRTADQRGQLEELYGKVARALEPVRERMTEVRKEIAELRIPSALVMEERSSFERPATHLRLRGSFLNKGELVYSGTPKVLPALPESEPPNRLGLARWLVHDDNPLTARVLVNRLWAEYFGRGIVETTEDFGTQGAPPTHPELLDWLATELQRLKWDLKAFHKVIVTSATYRQSSRASAELMKRDPYNKLYARGPRFRLDAEAIRDVSLHVGGLLSRKLGGPSVFPPQPEGIWNVPYSSERWVTSSGEDRYRRALYTFIRRSAPYPSMVAFDAPSREVCTARRVRTNTPLQALTTLNDPAFFEAAQGMGRRLVQEARGDVEARARFAFRLATGRSPRPDELAPIAAYFRDERARLAKDPGSASKLAGAGIDAAKAVDVAAWTMVGNVLLNLDETLTKE